MFRTGRQRRCSIHRVTAHYGGGPSVPITPLHKSRTSELQMDKWEEQYKVLWQLDGQSYERIRDFLPPRFGLPQAIEFSALTTSKS